MDKLRKPNAFRTTSNLSKYLIDHFGDQELGDDVRVEKNSSLKFRRLQQDGFYLIKSGLLKLEKATPVPRLVRLCSAGDIAGFGSWSAPQNSQYRLTAITSSEVQFWTKTSIYELKDAHPEINDLIIDLLIQNLLHKDERISILEALSSEQRFSQLLVWLAASFGVKSDDGILIDVELGREELAQLSGVTAVTIARNVTRLEDQGIIRRKRRKLLITDLEKLKRV